MILFVDSSVLVKLYLEEQGSERMRQAVAHGNPVAASDLAFAEVHAAFARQSREGRILAPEFDRLRLQLAGDWPKLTKVSIGPEILSLVPDLCARHPLRGADALHLASALHLQLGGLETTFACSDRVLLAAAASEGLAVFDPVQAE